MNVPEQLRVIAEKATRGERPKETVRTLLSWFGHHRRGLHVINNVRAVLEETRLETDPDFELAFFDGPIAFSFVPEVRQRLPIGTTAAAINENDAPNSNGRFSKDPVVRVDILKAANNKNLCTVVLDTRIEEAMSLMSTRHFSQLPVMQGQREVSGMISWKSIGEQTAWGRDCRHVRDCIENAEVIPWDTPLITAVAKIVEHDTVLVRGLDGSITGLITTTDLSLEFRKLSEPFLLLGEIENHVRRIIRGKFSILDLATIKNPNDGSREIEDVSDLTMGEYIRLLQNPENWKRLECKHDRKVFVERLESVRRIRNEVMHFHPDPVEIEDIELLQEITRFFRAF